MLLAAVCDLSSEDNIEQGLSRALDPCASCASLNKLTLRGGVSYAAGCCVLLMREGASYAAGCCVLLMRGGASYVAGCCVLLMRGGASYVCNVGRYSYVKQRLLPISKIGIIAIIVIIYF